MVRFLSVLVLAGCAGHLASGPPSTERPWHGLSSANFELRTDLDVAEGRKTLSELEQLRSALLTCFRASPDTPTGRIQVIALGDGWGDFASDSLEGFFSNGILFRPLMLLHARMGHVDLERQETIKHELTHFLTNKVSPNQPLWLSEGLATYFQTIELDPAERHVIAGKPPEDLLQIVQRLGSLGSAELRQRQKIATVDWRDIFYPSAWLMTHYLMNHRVSALRAYQIAVRRQSETEAWDHAFPDLPAERLDFVLRSYVVDGQYALFVFPLDVRPVTILSERALTDAEVHATRGLLFATARSFPRDESTQSADELTARAHREIAEALRGEPFQVLGQAVAHFLLSKAVDPVEAELATKRHPDDWMAWVLLAEALRDSSDRERYRRAQDQAVDLALRDPAVTLELSRRTAIPPSPTSPGH
jgi:hypothetical protein